MRGFFLFLILFWSLRYASPEERMLLIANFDSGGKPSNIGGDFGSWVGDPYDKTQGCMEDFCRYIRRGSKGYALKITYDVDSLKPAYVGVWFKLNGADFSGYEKLVFWVKGDQNRGFTRTFKVELKNERGEVGSYYVDGVKEDWRKIEIPLEDFQMKDLRAMEELVFVFESDKVTEKEGILYIDDIHLIGQRPF